MMATGEEKKANFIDQWAPTLLILGLYNNMVNRHGSDAAGHWGGEVLRACGRPVTTAEATPIVM